MFLQNQVLNDTYQVLRPIGTGGASSVYLAFHLRLRKYVVIKQLRGSFSQDFLARTEVDILKNLHHPNLPQVYDFIENEGYIYTVIDYVDGCDLDTYAKAGTRFTEAQLKHYLHQIGQVLSYLHSQNPPVIHSDIKPGNVILNGNGDAILIDFNTSIGANQGNLLGLTPTYASPEQIALANYAMYGRWADFQLDCRSDIYSLGATFYELISGIRPIPGVEPQPLHTMSLPEYSRDFLRLIDQMVVYDREKRLKSAKKLVMQLERMDSSIMKVFALRCASLLLCAGLLGGGIYCCVRGTQQAVAEDYRTQYQAAAAYISAGEPESAEIICDQILDDEKMQAYLKREPAEMARFYHVLGDAAYYQEQYGVAAAYYEKAVDYGKTLDRTTRSAFYRDAAISFANDGNEQQAYEMLQAAEEQGAMGSDLLLIQVVLDSRQGNVAQCLQGAETLFQMTNNQEILLRASLSMAAVADTLQMRIDWLLKAVNCGGGRTVNRQLANAYGQLAEQSEGKTRKEALDAAQNLYDQLCQWEHAPVEDFINYSAILRMNGDSYGATRVLQEGLSRKPGDYRLLMNMCFAYYELGDQENTRFYCADAIRAWRSDNSQDKLREDTDQIQDLLKIGELYEIGG